MSEINEFRISAPPEDLDKWVWFLEEMEKRQLITIYEKSNYYNNRGDSKFKRLYIKLKLNAEKPN
ncbi:hypothetical protein [Iningainema tapete]|uniref:Uncharacterized protein n=1 Tax=Iningainema tapete BLCC-T55 TaxID=2748662 RepID=A0A8J6XE72_9CYAN|nr:hypothetical protein [Iningainema tapete]MBD2772058.1 hypothetical protein [Iningainema tapete BLCC-T55]